MKQKILSMIKNCLKMPMDNLIEYIDNYLKASGIHGNIIEMNQMLRQKILNHSNPRLEL